MLEKRLLYWRTQAVLCSSWPSQKRILRLVCAVTQRWSLRTQVSPRFLLLDFWLEHPTLGTIDLEPKGAPS